jgi:hypothetical protein
VEGFLEALRLELQHEGVPISVTNVLPASINTPLFTRARSKLGVQPQGLGPLYQPDQVAEAILYAAEHPTRDLVVGGAGQALLLLQWLSPALADAYLRLTGFTGQRTQVPRPAGAPDNLFRPLEGGERIAGDVRDRAHPTSLSRWFQTHPGARRVLAGTVLGVITLLARRALRRAA